MTKTNWKIEPQWIKPHAGIKGNELADIMAKEAAANENIKESYKRVPKSVVLSELVNKSVAKLQREWTQSTKGRTTKEFYMDVTESLIIKINLTKTSQPWSQAMEKKLIFTPFQNNRSSDMPLRHQRSEYRKPTI